MNFATKASRWKMTFCRHISICEDIRRGNDTYAAVPDPVFVECAPFDHVRFQDVVDFWHEFEGQGLSKNVSKKMTL
jgi:hypothetical protein